jgi:hypothetical protein
MPASIAASGTVRSAAHVASLSHPWWFLPKYVRAADSMPYAPLPKYDELRYSVRIFCLDHLRVRW